MQVVKQSQNVNQTPSHSKDRDHAIIITPIFQFSSNGNPSSNLFILILPCGFRCGAICLSALVIVEVESTLVVQTVGPETLDGCSVISCVGDQQPEAKDRLGQDVKNGVGNDLAIDG